MVNENRVMNSATEEVLRFSKEFYLRFGVYPTVLYSLNKDKPRAVTLPELEEIVNNMMEKDIGPEYKVKTKTRLRDVVSYRQLTFKILYDMGYTITAISKYFGFNHATILYSKSHADDFLQLNDSKFLNIYNSIIYEINQKNGIDDLIQSNIPRKVNT